jgi:hypothetical protein
MDKVSYRLKKTKQKKKKKMERVELHQDVEKCKEKVKK